MAAVALLPPFFFLVLLFLYSSGGIVKEVAGQKTWCMAKPSTDDKALLENLHYACSMEDCNLFARHGPCFLPDILISHASIVMNLYYQSKGRNPWNCHFNATGLFVLIDPSYGKCTYD